MNKKDPQSIALRFNEYINNQDIKGLSNLMTNNHLFIDRDGNTVISKQKMLESWQKFFTMFPKYKNTFSKVKSIDDLVILIGYAYWSEQKPHDDAIWVAKIEDRKVAEWRIYANTPENRKKLNIN